MKLSENIAKNTDVTVELVDDQWALAVWELKTGGWTLRGKVIKGKQDGRFAAFLSSKINGAWVSSFEFADTRQEKTVKDTVARLYDKLLEQKNMELTTAPPAEGYSDPINAAGSDMPF